MEIAVEVAFRSKDDADKLFSWRNDRLAKEMSIHSYKTSDQFWECYRSRYFALRDLPSFFASVQGKRVAFVGFDPVPKGGSKGNSKSACISIVVDPSQRGKGIGLTVLKRACLLAKQQGFSELIAHIKPKNLASIAIFKKAGFTKEKSFTETVGERRVALELYRLDLVKKRPNQKVFIIAEAGSNWRLGSYERDLKMAKTLIGIAKDAGCDAIKFQTYRSHTVYAPGAGKSDYLSETGFVEDIKAIFDDLSMPYKMIPELFQMCKRVGIEFMSSAFSKADFKAIDPYVKRHKIASYEISHVRLLELAAKSKKPLILSTGASSVADIQWAVDYFYRCGGKDLTLLQCSAQYPAAPCAMNLRAIPWMREHFGVPVGLSDHSFDPNLDPYLAAIGAVALGATVIEKHFTASRRLVGPDHAFAVEPDELKKLVVAVRQMEEMAGTGYKEIQKEEQELYDFARRRVQALSAIKKGERFVEDKNVAILRPGKQKGGVHPRFMDEIAKCRSTRNIKTGEGIQLGDWQ